MHFSIIKTKIMLMEKMSKDDKWKTVLLKMLRSVAGNQVPLCPLAVIWHRGLAKFDPQTYNHRFTEEIAERYFFYT